MCVIGCGPSGLSFLHHAALLEAENPDLAPEVTCFEKQDCVGGLWNYTWRTGKLGMLIKSTTPQFL